MSSLTVTFVPLYTDVLAYGINANDKISFVDTMKKIQLDMVEEDNDRTNAHY